jgi:hypothetical protein
MKQPTDTKEVYEKPTIVIKQVEMATVAGQYTGGGGPIGILWPIFGICCGGGS